MTPAGLTRMGFDAAALARYLPAGTGPQGVMNFSMYDVVHNPTRWLTPDDAGVMAAYLMGSRPVAPSVVASLPPASALPAARRQTYLQLCSACHGVDGEGIAHVAPPMRTNASLRVSSPRNLLVVVTGGLLERPLPGGERFQATPAFGHLLDDQQIADLATWLRGTWGGTAAAVTQDEVRAVRSTMP